MRIGALLGMLASATFALVAKREVVPDSDVPLDYGTRASVAIRAFRYSTIGDA